MHLPFGKVIEIQHLRYGIQDGRNEIFLFNAITIFRYFVNYFHMHNNRYCMHELQMGHQKLKIPQKENKRKIFDIKIRYLTLTSRLRNIIRAQRTESFMHKKNGVFVWKTYVFLCSLVAI